MNGWATELNLHEQNWKTTEPEKLIQFSSDVLKHIWDHLSMGQSRILQQLDV